MLKVAQWIVKRARIYQYLGNAWSTGEFFPEALILASIWQKIVSLITSLCTYMLCTWIVFCFDIQNNFMYPSGPTLVMNLGVLNSTHTWSAIFEFFQKSKAPNYSFGNLQHFRSTDQRCRYLGVWGSKFRRSFNPIQTREEGGRWCTLD